VIGEGEINTPGSIKEERREDHTGDGAKKGLTVCGGTSTFQKRRKEERRRILEKSLQKRVKDHQ